MQAEKLRRAEPTVLPSGTGCAGAVCAEACTAAAGSSPGDQGAAGAGAASRGKSMLRMLRMYEADELDEDEGSKKYLNLSLARLILFKLSTFVNLFHVCLFVVDILSVLIL